MKLLVTTALCMLMALPMSAQNNYYRHTECEHTMTSRQVDDVIDLISSTSFDDNKLKVAKVCIQLRPVTTNDIRQIARSFSFSDAKKKFLYFAIDYCTDIRNYYTLRSVLSFSSDQNEFSEFVDEYMHNQSGIQVGRR